MIDSFGRKSIMLLGRPADFDQATWDAENRDRQVHQTQLRAMLAAELQHPDWRERGKWEALYGQPLAYIEMMLTNGSVRDPRQKRGRPSERVQRQIYVDQVKALRASGETKGAAIDAVAATMSGDAGVMAGRLTEWLKPPRKRKRRE